MARPYLKNKGSAVRFCLWPQSFLSTIIKSVNKTIKNEFEQKCLQNNTKRRYPDL